LEAPRLTPPRGQLLALMLLQDSRRATWTSPEALVTQVLESGKAGCCR
jgi:hypothetical protein